jgi:hypothetical protein
MSIDQILVPLQKVALGLEELLSEVVFVGGATVPFYLDHPELEEIRVTDDVDIVYCSRNDFPCRKIIEVK